MKYFYCVIGLFVLLQSCDESKAPELKDYQGTMLETTNIHSTYSDSGRVKLKFDAPLQRELKDGNQEFPEGLYVQFFDKAGNVSSTLIANYGLYYKLKKRWLARGNVQLANIEKDSLFSEELYWSMDNKKIYTDKNVTIITKDSRLWGEGLEADETLTNYEILHPVGRTYINNK